MTRMTFSTKEVQIFNLDISTREKFCWRVDGQVLKRESNNE